MTASPLVLNFAAACAGECLGHADVFGAVETLGQGDATSFFLSIGQDVERQTASRYAGVRAMDTMVQVAFFLSLTSKDMTSDPMLDLLSFFAGRIRHGHRIFEKENEL